MKNLTYITVLFASVVLLSCRNQTQDPKVIKKEEPQLTARDILGNSDYLAISYGGYRLTSRDQQPTIAELKEDLLILHAMGIRILRTYNVHLPHASNVLKAIRELKTQDASFEMYVMLGAWIDCKNAWTGLPVDHNQESERNEPEIQRAVALAQTYPDIVKVIAVGNEAMVKWAEAYYVQADVILKWVEYLQNLKKEGKLAKDLWITSSDNFASWGGGGPEYHTLDLEKLIKAVDYLSIHTYPMHDTHYNPAFWGVLPDETGLSKTEIIHKAMDRSLAYAVSQFDSVRRYMKSLGVEKTMHIGETGWASYSNELYGNSGSKATDEYKQALYYQKMRKWSHQNQVSCFFFEAFDEPWKDAQNPQGSENHFGLFTVDGQAKFSIWEWVDKGVFTGLSRSGKPISKTYKGDEESLLQEVLLPPVKDEILRSH
ncbi:MAG: glycosyl hydrolase family 17 protein [Flavobacteriaceae bacterium]|nr:glycosyl hydrolase family 17 protein [Flavobacteriaceae bacterium]